MNYKEAIENLKTEYDAFYIENKYGSGTHNEEFELLSTLKGEKVHNALAWIKDCYDCYYENELEANNPFDYLESLITGETE
jgi:hypothetical protein